MAEGILNTVQTLEADIGFDVYSKAETDALLDLKADKADTYTKEETNALLAEKADSDSVYTKTETDTLLSAKADADSVYTKSETDTLLSSKADKATTLAGYGITDAYTTTETDNLLSAKANSADVYTKTESDNKFAEKATTLAGYGITDGYTKTEVDSALALKANLASPTFTGTPKAPTASAGTNTTQIATTAFVTSAVKVPADRLEKLISILEGQIYDYETDSTPAYTKTVPAGAVEHANLDLIGGKTVVWNQLVQNGDFADGTGWNGNVANNEWSYSDTITSYVTCRRTSLIPLTINHKYYISAVVSSTAGKAMFLPFDLTTYGSRAFSNLSGNQMISWIYTAQKTDNATLSIRFQVTTSGVSETITATVSNYMCVDLTLMYGSGNEPSTVDEFRQTFPAVYYAFTLGTLLSADVTSVVSKDTDNTTIDTYNIPADIQALSGYGLSTNGYYNEIDFENKRFIQRVGKIVYDGSADENWSYSSSYNYFYTPAIADAINANSNPNNILCNKHTYGTIANTNTDTGICLIWSAIRVRLATMPTLADWKTELSNNPMTVYYQLATPQETDISSYLTDDTIAVESGGTLIMVNSHGDDYRIAVPNTETFLIDLEYALDH